MKRAQNNTNIKKGDTLYYVSKSLYSIYGVKKATIKRITTTAEYIICHMECDAAGVFSNLPAIFYNIKRNQSGDITERYYLDCDDAERRYDELRLVRRRADIGGSVENIFRNLK